MIKFLDGPAKGTVLDLRRAPVWLRVVIDSAGQVDALDQLDDTPAADEAIYVYRIVGEPTRYHLCCHPRSRGGWRVAAEYVVHKEPVDDTVLRDNEQWREWAMSQGEQA